MSLTGLDPSRIAEVDIITAPSAVSGRNFGNLLILSVSSAIDTDERIRDYSTIDDIATDFGTTGDTYKAASLFFSQIPQPTHVKVGRWAYTATPGSIAGGSIALTTLATLQGITSGGFDITINGSVQHVLTANFSAQTNLNGCASIITAKLSGATCAWDSQRSRFTITSTATGAGTSATGTYTFGGVPSNNDTLTINGTVITFVTSGATGRQINIPDSATATATAVVAHLYAHPIADVYATSSGAIVTIHARVPGTAGNSYGLLKSCSVCTASGSGTLTGGVQPATVSYASAPASGVDISSILGLTSALANVPVNGIAAESMVEAVNVLAERSVDWYGLAHALAPEYVTSNDILAVAAYIEAASPSRIFGVTTQDAGVLDATNTSNLAYLLKASNYRRTFTMYSSTNAHAALSIFGRAFTVNFNGVNTTITLKFKDAPGLTPEYLTAVQAEALRGNNCNVFAAYSNGASIIQEGVMSKPTNQFFDEVHGLDWLQNAIQTEIFNAFYTSTTKIPQTDDGMGSLVAVAAQVLETAVSNGLIAPNQWNAEGFGELNRGDWLSRGYYIYAKPMRLQLQSDREQRKAPPMQIAVKLAGAIHSAIIQVNVNR